MYTTCYVSLSAVCTVYVVYIYRYVWTDQEISCYYKQSTRGGQFHHYLYKLTCHSTDSFRETHHLLITTQQCTLEMVQVIMYYKLAAKGYINSSTGSGCPSPVICGLSNRSYGFLTDDHVCVGIWDPPLVRVLFQTAIIKIVNPLNEETSAWRESIQQPTYTEILINV